MKNNDLRLAYIAGFFDGEGYIGIINILKRGRNRYFIEASVVNSNPLPLEFIRDFFELGTVRKRDMSTKVMQSNQLRSHKNIYRITFRDAQAEQVLKAIYPYLIVKKEQARLCLALQERLTSMELNRSSKFRTTNRISPLPQAEWDLRENYFTQVKELNRRGIILEA